MATKKEGKGTNFILALVLQVFILVAIIFFNVSVVTSGAEVILNIQPVDPRDPLRDDYVTFQYDISNLPNDLFLVGPQEGQTVFVPLFRQITQGNIWVAGQYITTALPRKVEQPYLKGKVTRAGLSEATITYGIEEYFIPEGTGRDFNFAAQNATAQVSVDGRGNAVVTQIYIEGRAWPN